MPPSPPPWNLTSLCSPVSVSFPIVFVSPASVSKVAGTTAVRHTPANLKFCFFFLFFLSWWLKMDL